MYRAFSLLVVLAHLSVASTPCFETEYAQTQLSMTGDWSTHPAAAARGQEEPQPAEHAHHRSTDEHAHHQQGDHPSHSVAEARVVLHELRAPCMCGCGSKSQSPGATTSLRLGFALFPAKSPSLATAESPLGVPATIRLPAPLADSLDHVPIFS